MNPADRTLIGHDALHATASPDDAPRAPFLAAMTAPWLGIVDIGTAARRLTQCSFLAFLVTYGLHLLLFTSLVVAFRAWHDTVTLGFVDGYYLMERTVGEVWQDWQHDGPLGVALRTFAGTGLLMTVATLALAWLHLPTLHMRGPLRSTFARCFRAVTAGAALLIVALCVIAPLFVNGLHQVRRATAVGLSSSPSESAAIATMTAGSVIVCLIVARISCGIRALQSPVPQSEAAPRCEGCGYDLTHLPDSGQCPECAFSVADSITPGQKRAPSAWETRRGLRAWCRTSFDCLFTPASFYQHLVVRTPDARARALARWHYLVIGLMVAGVVWVGATFPDGTTRSQIAMGGLAAAFAAALLAWAGHHFVGVMVIFWWAARGSTLKLYLTRKLLSYETAYLSLACLCMVLLLTSFGVYGPWVTATFGRDLFARTLRMSGESVAVVILAGILGAVGQWRVTLAILGARWSNF